MLLVVLISLLQCCASRNNNLGGATCGSIVANRLSELSDVSVVATEAHTLVLNNSKVTDINILGTLPVETLLDWQYKIVDYIYEDNKRRVLNAGKAIDSTSTVDGKLVQKI